MPFGFGSPGFYEMLIIGVIALLLFGKRLPEVARSLGKGIVEFKKGVQGIEQEVETATYTKRPSRSVPEEEEREEMTAPKFQPPESAPVEAEQKETQQA